MTPEQAPDGVRKAVDNAVVKINQTVKSRARRVSNALRNAELEVLSGQRSGRKYRKPHTKRATYTASAPGEPPARRTGNLRLRWNVGMDANPAANGGVKVTSYIESETPYAGHLEDGTERMAARPYVKRIKEKAKPEIEQIMGEDYS